MKKCPFCAEDIQEEAVKCRYCGEFLNKSSNAQWYFKTNWVIIGFLCAGPLAFPLLWFNPRYSKRNKIITTVIVSIITYYFTVVTIQSVKTILNHYDQLFL